MLLNELQWVLNVSPLVTVPWKKSWASVTFEMASKLDIRSRT